MPLTYNTQTYSQIENTLTKKQLHIQWLIPTRDDRMLPYWHTGDIAIIKHIITNHEFIIRKKGSGSFITTDENQKTTTIQDSDLYTALPTVVDDGVLLELMENANTNITPNITATGDILSNSYFEIEAVNAPVPSKTPLANDIRSIYSVIDHIVNHFDKYEFTAFPPKTGFAHILKTNNTTTITIKDTIEIEGDMLNQLITYKNKKTYYKYKIFDNETKTYIIQSTNILYEKRMAQLEPSIFNEHLIDELHKLHPIMKTNTVFQIQKENDTNICLTAIPNIPFDKTDFHTITLYQTKHTGDISYVFLKDTDDIYRVVNLQDYTQFILDTNNVTLPVIGNRTMTTRDLSDQCLLKLLYDYDVYIPES